MCVGAASALAWFIFLQLRAVTVPHGAPNGGAASVDQLDVIKTTITVAGFVGAVLVGVYGYRKQRVLEGDAHRADAEQFAARYTTAADQLGHERAAVRLAGVYAMARLADDWGEQRQVCIDVLCAYLRMPYETDIASEKYREGEREVRSTIIRIIRDHLQDQNVPTTWCGFNLDFTNATFDGGEFDEAKFTGGNVSFRDAEFIGGCTNFSRAVFVFGRVSFQGAKFTGGKVSFWHAEFIGECDIFFGLATFSGGSVSFEGARFAGGDVYFSAAKFIGGDASFRNADFVGGRIVFFRTGFIGGDVSFCGAKFAASVVEFIGVNFSGGAISFREAEYSGGDVSFSDGLYAPDCNITWGPFEPPAAWTVLQERAATE
jgi:uncharacterized protein YjbI with pentapeptide repeats